jgi:UDP-N-acetylglucosamine acyltransferase
MSTVPLERIHPTAIISPKVELADDTVVGPFAVLEGTITVGPGCRIDQGARIVGTVTLGKNNRVGAYVVLGEKPQHIKYADEPTRVEIGDNNTFREFVTVHRGTTHSWTTRIGNNNYFMATSHVAHDCILGNNCMLANSALLAGHCILEDNVLMSGHSAMHQFCRVGRLAMIAGLSGSARDVPPFMIVQGISTMRGVNVIGMRRAGIPTASVDAVRRAYFLLYKLNLSQSEALDRMLAEHGDVPEIQELVGFIRGAGRGIMQREYREAA